MSSISITDGIRKIQAEARDGETILEVLQRAGAQVDAVCGGNGTCGKCRVQMERNGEAAEVLACQTRVEGDCAVRTESGTAPRVFASPEEAIQAARLRAAKAEQSRLTAPDRLLAAVDLGSTTVAVQVFDPERPGQKITASGWNVQRSFGADVISRIHYINENEDGLQLLGDRIRQQIAELIAEAVGDDRKPEAVYIAGNTVMEHIAAGISPTSIASAPFEPETLFDDDREFEIDGMPAKFAPCVAGYVGGDITVGMQSSGIIGMAGKYLYLDIGTNGEMALIDDGNVTCCAVASGPAFEGAGISCGMAGTEGAVSHVLFNGREWKLRTVGGAEPVGICGSGIIDLMAQLVRTRMVDGYGRLLPPSEQKPEYAKFFTEDENGNGVLHLTDNITFTAADVRQVQLAQAAVAAGIEVLLKETGTSVGEIHQLLLAGGFGVHIDPTSACLAGMIPKELEMRTRSIGNASLAGACSAVTDPEAEKAILTLKEKCRYIELSGNEDFNELYPEHMVFYEEE